MSTPLHLVERRIQEAYERGEFENLPGYGRPIPDLDEPVDELWWIRKWMKREQIDLTKELEALTPQERVRLLRDLSGR